MKKGDYENNKQIGVNQFLQRPTWNPPQWESRLPVPKLIFRRIYMLDKQEMDSNFTVKRHQHVLIFLQCI